ncbi:MAG: hypothetical protein DMG15_15735 [Acidobacteria bacterium]|nr:MAG: hypothetical protein DMG15_15735 [Acidobacteriota bacterium]
MHKIHKMLLCLLCLFVASLPSASAQNNNSRDALFAAIQRGAIGDVERLLKSGVSPNLTDAEGTPALMAAILFADSRMVELLLQHGADANQSGPSGTTALMWAMPDLAKARLLIAHGANVNARPENDRTALLVAASYSQTVDLLRLLLDKGADLRAQDKGGATALGLALRSADVEVVRFLVDRGLDLNALSPAARSAALARHDLPTVDYLMSKVPSPIPNVLNVAATWQPAPFIARWIELGADVNATNAAQYARTPVMTAVASETESTDTLKLLLGRGADPNARMTEGESPLDLAIYKGDRAKIKLLEQHGAKRGDGPRQEEIPPPAQGGIRDPRTSLTKSVARLLDAAPGFREKTNCISCHHNSMPALAAATVRKKGIDVDDARARKNLDDLFTFFKSAVPRMMLGDPAVGGEAITAGYSQMALAAAGHPLDTTTAAMTHWLMARQMPDGRWLGNGVNRPPSEYSTISHTALGVGGLKSYPIPGRKKEISESIRRARQWLLLSAEPKSAEERAMLLMGLVWSEAPRARLASAIKEVRDHQEASGGWSQFGRTPPDAYATGMSLYALHVAGVPTTDEAYRKGVAFLLSTQYPDGAWFVRSHSFPIQRYFESGFPFGRHQWISSAGTSWAALAIAQTLPEGKK